MNRRRPEAPHHHVDPRSMWVFSDLAPDGSTYILSVQVGDRIFSPSDPVGYARTVITLAQEAVYLSGAARQLGDGMGLDRDDIAKTVGLFRGKLEDALAAVIASLSALPVDNTLTGPLTFRPGVNTKLDPFLDLHYGETHIGQLSPAEAMGHAVSLLELSACVVMDNVYRTFLTGPLGLPIETAQAVVGDVGEFFDREPIDRGIRPGGGRGGKAKKKRR